MFKNKSGDWWFGFWAVTIFIILVCGLTLMGFTVGDSSASLLPDSDCIVVEYNDPSLFGTDVNRDGVYCPEPVK